MYLVEKLQCMPEPFQSVSPSGLQWNSMSMPYFSRQAQEQVARHPDLVGGPLRALAEHLEFPLALRHFGVDAFVVDAGREAEVEVLLDDLAGDVADVLVADAGVVRALRRRVSLLREAERTAVLVEEVLLLEAEPGALVVQDGGAAVRRMRRDAVRHHHFAHHQRAVGAGGIGIDRDRLEHAVRRVALGLHGRRTVEAPQRQLVERRELVELLDLRLAAQIGDGRIAVQPDVLELELRHSGLSKLVRGIGLRAGHAPANRPNLYAH
jgi:hypothetical protein